MNTESLSTSRNPRLSPKPERYLPVLLASTFYGIAYLLSVFLKPYVVLKYLPVENSWTLTPPEGVITMSYFGMLMFSAALFAVGYALAFVPPIRRWLATPRGQGIVGWTCLLVYMFAFGFFFVEEISHWASK
jgi:hypothetical protein